MKFVPRVLIVDDDPSSITLLKAQLSKAGELELHAASDGKQALALAEKNDFALAFVDINMPRMDGFELTRRLKVSHNNEPVPVIILTAMPGHTENLLNAYGSGAVDFITKPIDKRILLCKTRVFLEFSKRKDNIFKLNQQLEETLKEKSTKLNETRQSLKLINNAEFGMYQMSVDGEILILNHTAEQMLGIVNGAGSKELINKNLNILKQQCHRLNGNNALNNDKRETSFLTTAGNAIHVLDTAQAVVDENLKVKYIEGTLNDITEIVLSRNLFEIQKTLGFDLLHVYDIKTAAEIIVKKLTAIEGIDTAGFYSFKPGTRQMLLEACQGISEKFRCNVMVIGDETPEFEMVLTGSVTNIALAEMPLYKQNDLRDEGIKDLLIIPFFKDSEILGHINLATKSFNRIPSQTQEMILKLLPLITESLHRIHLYRLQQQSYQNLKEIFDTTDDYIFILDQQGNIINANKCVEDKLGYSQAEFIGKSVLMMHPPEYRDIANEVVGRMLQSGEKLCSLPLINKSGKHIQVETRVNKGLWNGEPVLIGTSRDISDRIRQDGILQYRLDFESLLTNMSLKFMNIDFVQTDETINSALGDIGRFLEVDRSYIFLYSDNRQKMNNTHEWCQQGIEPAIEMLQNLDTEIFPWWMYKLSNGQIINITDIDDLPPEAASEKEILAQQDIKSVFVIPIVFESELLGFAGFDAVKKHIVFSEDTEKMLTVAASIFANSLEHRRKNIALLDYQNNLQQKVDLRTAQINETNLQLQHEILEHENTGKQLKKLTLAIEQSGVLIIITNTDGIIEYCNPKVSQVTGYDIQELIGATPAILNSGQQPDDMYKKLYAAIKSGKNFKSEIVNKKKNGTLINFNLNIAPVKNNKAEIVNFIAVYEDTTRQKQMEQQLMKSQKMEAIGLLASGIAHDFNNLLQIIRVYADIIKMAGEATPGIIEYINQIDSAVDRGSKTVSALLEYSHKRDAAKHHINLSLALNDFSHILKTVLPRTVNVELTTHDSIFIYGDQGLLEQVLINLAMNANDAMHNKGNLRIGLNRTEVPAPNNQDVLKGYALLSVEDNGCGIKNTTLNRIFDPFYTTKKVGEGMGLGLSMVARIIDDHDGFIEVKSQQEVGTRFEIYLPLSDS